MDTRHSEVVMSCQVPGEFKNIFGQVSLISTYHMMVLSIFSFYQSRFTAIVFDRFVSMTDIICSRDTGKQMHSSTKICNILARAHMLRIQANTDYEFVLILYDQCTLLASLKMHINVYGFSGDPSLSARIFLVDLGRSQSYLNFEL